MAVISNYRHRMERDHSQSNGVRETTGTGRLGRRSYLKASGTALATLGGLFTGVGGATASSEGRTIEFNYDACDATTDIYAVERPERAQFVEQGTTATETTLELTVPQNESWGTNTTFDLPANGLGEPTELYQSIRMRLDEAFSFRESGDNCRVFNAGLNSKWGTSGSGTDGPPTGADGWSSRLYVIDNGSRTGPFGLNVYTYHMDQQSGPGEEEVLEGDLFSPGEWHDIETYVRMNTVNGNRANADGVVRVWVDGAKVYDRGDFRWTTTPDQGHHRAGPVAHWGGPETPSQNSCIYYKDHRLVVGSNPRN